MPSGRQKGAVAGATAAAILSSFFTPIHSSAAILQWDPSPLAGIQGGPGAWTTSATNWDNGVARVAWSNISGSNDTAVFGGTAGGTITVTSSLTVGVVQFDTAGYTLGAAGSPALALSSGSVIANFDVAVAMGLVTPTGVGLVKTGSGVLTLQTSNTIRGNLTLAGGTVAFTAEPQLAVTARPVEFAGGGLRYNGAAALTFNAARTFVVTD